MLEALRLVPVFSANKEEQEVETVQKMSAMLYRLVQEQTQNPAALAFVRMAGKQWIQIVAREGFGVVTNDPEAIRVAAVTYLRSCLPTESEIEAEIKITLTWTERLIGMFALRAHRKMLSQLRTIASKLN